VAETPLRSAPSVVTVGAVAILVGLVSAMNLECED
jgi:hypothetical protein